MLKKIAVFLFSLLLLLMVAFGYLLWFANTDSGREYISAKATNMLDRQVVYDGNLGLAARWPLTLRISGLTVDNMQGGRAEQMLDIGQAEVSVRLLPLFAGRISLPYLMLADSEVHLERTAEQANWQFGDPKPQQQNDEESNLYLGRLDLSETVISYYDQPQRIDVQVTARTEDDQVQLDGSGTYMGQAFQLDATGGEVLSVQREGPYPVDIKATVGNTTGHAEGQIMDPMHFGGLDVTLRLQGADAADLFPLFGIALPPTPPYNIEGQLHYADEVWSFKQFSGTMGNSDISGDVTWDQSGERPLLKADFLSQKLDLVDLGPLIGLAPAEPESAEQEEYAETREESPYLIPDVPLDITRLRAMDADVTYKGQQVISPYLPLDDFLLDITLDNSLLRIDPVRFGTADGDVISRLTVNARQEPVQIDSDFTFSRLSLARLTQGLNESLPIAEESEGLLGGTAKLKGHGKSLKDMLATSNGAVGFGMEGGQLSNLLIELIGLDLAQGVGLLLTGDEPVQVRCVIGDFTVESGIMQSQALVIDTSDTNIQGSGTINLKTEEMDLRIVPHPKDPTLAALRVPLNINGTLKNPDLSFDKAPLLAKGAGAVALSALLTPVAGILALVEGGLGEDSNCAQLVRNMNANTGTTEATDNVPTNPGAPDGDAAPAESQPERANEEAQQTAPAEAMPEGAAQARPAPASSEATGSNEAVETPLRTPRMEENIVDHPGEVHPVER